MDVNVNVGSKIKENFKKHEPVINYTLSLLEMAALGFCIGYVKCISDIIKHPIPRD